MTGIGLAVVTILGRGMSARLCVTKSAITPAAKLVEVRSRVVYTRCQSSLPVLPYSGVRVHMGTLNRQG